jgi:hypothetical protein
MNTAIPPRFGIVPLCEVRSFGLIQRFFNLDIVTIDGIMNLVTPNAIKNPKNINNQGGIIAEKRLTGEFI